MVREYGLLDIRKQVATDKIKLMKNQLYDCQLFSDHDCPLLSSSPPPPPHTHTTFQCYQAAIAAIHEIHEPTISSKATAELVL